MTQDDGTKIYEKAIQGKNIKKRFEQVVAAMNQYSQHTKRSGIDDETPDNEFVKCVEEVMVQYNNFQEKEAAAKEAQQKKEEKGSYQSEEILLRSTGKLQQERKRKERSSETFKTDETVNSTKKSPRKYSMQIFLEEEIEDKKMKQEQFAKFQEIEMKNIELREKKLKSEEERHVREMEDRKEERNERCEVRNLMYKMLKQQKEMMDMLSKQLSK